MKLLKKLYLRDAKSSSKELKEFSKYVLKLCRESGAKAEMDEQGNIYAIKGVSETYPCVVAHLDEVHEKRGSDFKVKVDGDKVYGVQTGKNGKPETHGIGADDKNGIWIAINMIMHRTAVKCAFFVDEEIGCVGSSKSNMKFFENVRFIVEPDRRNNCDFITNIGGVILCSDEFIKDANLSKFGYKETEGMSTDVYTLKSRNVDVSCCNISCGYYNPHTNSEFTSFKDLTKCLAFVNYIFDNCTKVYKHEYTRKSYSSFGSYGLYSGRCGFYDYEEEEDDFHNPEDESDNAKCLSMAESNFGKKGKFSYNDGYLNMPISEYFRQRSSIIEYIYELLYYNVTEDEEYLLDEVSYCYDDVNIGVVYDSIVYAKEKLRQIREKKKSESMRKRSYNWY